MNAYIETSPPSIEEGQQEQHHHHYPVPFLSELHSLTYPHPSEEKHALIPSIKHEHYPRGEEFSSSSFPNHGGFTHQQGGLVRFDSSALIINPSHQDALIQHQSAQSLFGTPLSSSQLSAPVIKPRRRLGDRVVDRADGLSSLISKARVMSVETQDQGPSPLAHESEIGLYIEAIYTNDMTCVLKGMRGIRRYICNGNSEEHAQKLISYNVMPRLIQFLHPSISMDVLFEVLWIVTNIAAGPTHHTSTIVELGYIENLIDLLDHPSGQIRTQAVWAIGNIAGDREGYRDLVLHSGTIQKVLQVWEGEFDSHWARKDAFRTAMWVVDNMCRYRPNWHEMEPVFATLPQLLMHDDVLLLKECCWALSRMLHASGRHPSIDRMITPQLCQRLTDILAEGNTICTHPILRAISNLVSSKNNIHLDYMIQTGVLPKLALMLNSTYLPVSIRSSLQIFVLEIVANLALNPKHVYSVCEDVFVREIFRILREEIMSLRVEACHFFRNAASHKDSRIANFLYGFTLVEALFHLISEAMTDYKTLLVVFDTLNFMMDTKGWDDGAYRLMEARIPGSFNVLLDLYLVASGKQADDMNEDDAMMEEGDDCVAEEEDEEEDDSSDDEGRTRRGPISKSTKALRVRTLKQQVATRARHFLLKWYADSFKKAIQTAYEQGELFKGFGNISIGAAGQSDSLETLINDFQALHYAPPTLAIEGGCGLPAGHSPFLGITSQRDIVESQANEMDAYQQKRREESYLAIQY